VHSKSNSEYKDDALFKLYQFHYTLGEFNESDKYARMILESYPSSQFISRLKKSDYTSTQSSLQQRVEVKTPEVNNQDKSSAGNFTTQVGAFLDRKNAESLMIQVLKYGESWINEREVRGKIFYAVLVGKFSSESDANTLLERMRAELNLQGVILNLQ
ncbi:MAG: SPOR domain-containing protein, partial [Bacteroidetes bacterium]|nr:SPOR domain-containing protein [Bacteroidota bacterium]